MTNSNFTFTFANGILRVEITGDIDHHSAKRTREGIDSLITKENRKKMIAIYTLWFAEYYGILIMKNTMIYGIRYIEW